MCGDICMEMIYNGLHTYRRESYISKDLKEGSYGLYTVLHASHKAIHLKMTSACLSCSWEDTSLYFKNVCKQAENEPWKNRHMPYDVMK